MTADVTLARRLANSDGEYTVQSIAATIAAIVSAISSKIHKGKEGKR